LTPKIPPSLQILQKAPVEVIPSWGVFLSVIFVFISFKFLSVFSDRPGPLVSTGRALIPYWLFLKIITLLQRFAGVSSPKAFHTWVFGAPFPRALPLQ